MPNGQQALTYITGFNGTFKQISNVQYIWNYYNFPLPLPDNHGFNKEALIANANGPHFTCRDANAHLLLDYNHDGEIDIASGGFAYHEHAGRGINNNIMGAPFTNFWFDDNSLAR